MCTLGFGARRRVVIYFGYVVLRVGLKRPRNGADDSMLEGLKWESRKEHGHEHHGYSERKMKRAAIRRKPAASNVPMKLSKKPAAGGKKKKRSFAFKRLKKKPSRSS